MAIARDILHELFEYDNGVLRNKISRRRAKIGQPVGTVDSYGYLVASINGQPYKVHRLIYAMFYDTVPAVLDHINGDFADNRIENLRPATVTQNGYNRRINRTSSSKVKNVHPLKGKWMAQCQVGGVRKYLGVFDTKEQAAEVVKTFRTTHHKDFARHE